MKIQWKVLVVSLVVVYAVALIGSLFTSGNTSGEWYESVKPSITPPNWVFPIVWNVLFFLIALSLYFAWIRGKEKRKIMIFYGINFLLNILWSALFFSWKKTKLAFFELILLWLSILYLIIFTYNKDKKAAYLLIPYLLWVSFAGILNYLIVF